MEIREGLLYAKSHEWVKEEGDVVTIGLTDYAQSELGDLVFVNLPEEGDSVSVGEAFGDVESVKAVSDVYSPVSGVVCEINEELLDAPESINGAPYDAWFIKVKEVSEKEELLSSSEYEAFVASEQLDKDGRWTAYGKLCTEYVRRTSGNVKRDRIQFYRGSVRTYS